MYIHAELFTLCCRRSVPKSCLNFCDPTDCSMPGFPVLHYLPEFAQSHVHWVHWCSLTISSLAALFSFCLQSFPAWGSFPKSQLFPSGVQSIGASTSVIPIDWFDLLAVQGTLKNLLQQHNSKESNLWCSAFFMVQLSYPYITTGKTVALTIWIFVSKVMSLLSNMLFRFVIALLPS